MSSPTKVKFVRQTTAERQQNLQERVEAARRAERQKPTKVAPYVEYRNIDPACETALYYGFTPLPSPLVIGKEDMHRAKILGDEEQETPSLMPTLEEKVAMFRYYENKRLAETPQPVMFCTEFLSGAPGKKKAGEHRLSIEIMGGQKSIAEATVIQTAFATLSEEGHTDLVVAVNSVGDRESFGRFLRELGNYYRKHIASLPAPCRTLLRTNPIQLLKCGHEKCKGLVAETPKSMGCLGDESRRHFKEVLEFLEELEIPYCIDHSLLGSRAFATETVFEIRSMHANGSHTCLAAGVRCNNLGKRLGLKKEMPSVGANILLSRNKERAVSRKVRFKKPLVFFLQLGFCAKLKALKVIELLRQSKIPVYQALNRDKLIAQLSSAEHLKIPYSIILGQREALENSVIIRHTATRAQESVPISKLAEHMKKMKLA